MKWLLCFLITAASALGFGQYGSSPHANFNENVLRHMGVDQLLGNKVATDATFQEADGTTVRFGDLLGKRPLVVMPMYFECHGVCGISTDSLLKATIGIDKKTVGTDYDVVLLSINPAEDPSVTAPRWKTAEKLYRRDASAHGWHLLTGDLENIRRLTDSIGFKWVYDQKEKSINHPAGLVVLTKDGTISSYIIDSDYPAAFLNNMLTVAQEGKIGRKVQPNLVACITMDHATQTRSAAIENGIRIISAGFAVLLGLWIARMIMSERKKKNDVLTGGVA